MRGLVRSTALNAGGAIGEILIRILTVKIFALVMGPAGIGALAILRQVVDVSVQVASLSGGTALVRGASARDQDDQTDYIRTIASLYFVGLCLVLPIVLFAGPSLARMFLDGPIDNLESQFAWLLVLIVAYVLEGFLRSVTNVRGGYAQIALARILQPFVLLLFSYPVALAVLDQNYVPYILVQALSALACILVFLIYAKRAKWIAVFAGLRGLYFERSAMGDFLRVTLWLFAAALLASGGQLLIRLQILERTDISTVGLVDCAMQISSIMAGLILGPLQTYFLPQLSRPKENQDRSARLSEFLLFALLLAGPALVAMIVLKPLVVSLLYSSEFLPAIKLLRWLLTGDLMKITYWVIGTSILGAGRMRTLFLIDLVQYLGFAGLAVIWYWHTGDFEVIGKAYVLTQLTILLLGSGFVIKAFDFRPSARLLSRFTVAAVLVVLASLWTWSDVEIQWPAVLVMGSLCLAYLLGLSTREERDALYALVRRTGQGRSFNKD